MPIPRAACQTVVPFGTATVRPSMVRWTIATFCSLIVRQSPKDPPSGPHR